MSYPAQFLNRGHIYDLLIKNWVWGEVSGSFRDYGDYGDYGDY